jgi:tetratricopeptide (TPR) repeat protein
VIGYTGCRNETMVWRITLFFFLWFLSATASAAAAQSGDDPVGSIQSALRSRNYEQGLQLARDALISSPSDARIWTLEAIALSGLGKPQEALAAYTKALTITPDYLAALEGAAEIDYQAGSTRAVSLLNRILKQRPHDPTVHGMLAVLAYKKHDCKDAVNHFREADPIISSQPKASVEFGACLMELNQSADAIPLFERLLALLPNNRGVRYDLALVQFLAQKPQDATVTLQPLMEQKNQDSDVLDLASSAYEAQGFTPRATELLHEAIVLAPRSPKYYLDFAALCLAHSSYQVGVDMLSTGIAYLPKSAPLYLARGILHIQGGQYDEGEADFEVADHLDPTQAFSSEAIGITEVQESNLDEALKTVRLRLRDHPDDAFLHYLLAEILEQRGAPAGSPEFNQAVAAALQALRLRPDLTAGHDMLGGLYLKSGQIQQATEQCRLALKADPSDQNALYHLIQALRKAGKTQETPDLLKRLAVLRAAARNAEASQNRYKLVELDHESQ